ncbi:hypothetical protein [Devosia chinhatensis]|uniref:CheA signal transduction histidine kinase n=1 Tax=Devosia chinhatensis TaxID=429727 RepID=A0A0F5FF35_9HYPH|nr:hypothetical protein [Devosia chinhatensis]KKB07476.1 hypothetical protein VE26_12005 [Devosia chinhatensis]
MADYKELLRRAISALPENNGSARRAVYEKARSALVGQLRAIQPPLPARDITQHRLQLEDCIRQVEQEASEAIINLGRESRVANRPSFAAPRPTQARPEPVAPPPVVVPPAPVSEPDPVVEEPSAPQLEREPEPEQDLMPPAPEAEVAPKPAPAAVAPPVAKSIEDIIAEAAQASGATISAVSDETDSPAAEPAPTLQPVAVPAPSSAPERPSFFAPRRDTPASTSRSFGPFAAAPRVEPAAMALSTAPAPANAPVIIDPPLPVEPALSAVREVDVEGNGAREAEGAIERAIETLDREARGDFSQAPAAPELPQGMVEGAERSDESSFAAAEAQTRSGAGLTIFLVVFALLLVGVGGAGFWAWREDYIDLDQMFGRAQPVVTETAQAPEQATVPTLDTTQANPSVDGEGAAGPGNTATTTTSEPTSALEGLDAGDRLEPTPEAVTPNGTETVLPSIGTGENKTEERLSGADTSIAAADDPAASVDPVNLAGNQSLLLEASNDGQSGAVPFSGTVDWTEGVDDIGLPTLQARASIPARNLDVTLTIRKNSDPILPASHLMEITFDVPDTFMGGSIATLAGVLLKNEELVPGTALSGAAARVVGNSFLFALSASPNDVATNSDLLRSRRWMDLAVIYGTGRNAILTLEKDEDAQVLFDRALAAWAE